MSTVEGVLRLLSPAVMNVRSKDSGTTPGMEVGKSCPWAADAKPAKTSKIRAFMVSELKEDFLYRTRGHHQTLWKINNNKPNIGNLGNDFVALKMCFKRAIIGVWSRILPQSTKMAFFPSLIHFHREFLALRINTFITFPLIIDIPVVSIPTIVDDGRSKEASPFRFFSCL